MRRPAIIKPWLDPLELAQWTREAKDAPTLRRRLSVWLTFLGFCAREVAELIQVSTQAVWLWVRQYNRLGPGGLDRRGRGGRRWGYLSLEQERQILEELEPSAQAGQVLTAQAVRHRIEQVVGHAVSVGYIYRLFHRHGWRKVGPRPRHVKASVGEQEAFKKTFRCDGGRR